MYVCVCTAYADAEKATIKRVQFQSIYEQVSILFLFCVRHPGILALSKPRIAMNSITGPMDIIGEAEIVLKYDGLTHKTFALVA